jgi:hypothetical protein
MYVIPIYYVNLLAMQTKHDGLRVYLWCVYISRDTQHLAKVLQFWLAFWLHGRLTSRLLSPRLVDILRKLRRRGE